MADKEKKEVMDMLYKCKEAFSLRDEIGTCPNIEVEIDVTDKSTFFIRPHCVKGEDKKYYRWRNEAVMYFRHIKGRFFSAYSSPVMLISRKVTQGKE